MSDKQLPMPGLDNGLPIEKLLKNNGKPDRLTALERRVLYLELEVSLMRVQQPRIVQGNHCHDCRWWELLDDDPTVGGFGNCHHPTAEAQHIAHTGKPAPYGLGMEGDRRACPLFEPSKVRK